MDVDVGVMMIFGYDVCCGVVVGDGFDRGQDVVCWFECYLYYYRLFG